ncbi:hypothetical protein ACKUB1_13660 [Methanospirillum stamsii]|uniref:Bro-N domain-containing protein n=1 Tax=Methanospirillum stamsii TaxID=1277351 RepID=A0A2V2NEP0_9EURY|nr:hypothetical protein [Methanospirillum stamsii]PWR74847.1 hypothetical protein DLD82_08085 [Methanospirillum stamsii]
MSDSQIQVINAQTEDNLTGLVIESKSYLYWLRVYQALGLERHHAQKVISRLTEGIHFRKFSKEDIIQLSETGNTVLPVDHRAKSFVFLTAEGLNRAIIEIRTNEMDDKFIAAKIDEKKDLIANIYTRYQSGETLSKATEQPTLPGDILDVYAPVATVLEDQMAIANIMIKEGVEPAVAKSMAISVTEEITHCGNALTPWRPLIAADPFLSEPALLTPTDIGKDLGGMSARTVNQILVKLGFQKKIGSEWVPSQIGKMYARFVPQEIQHNRGMLRHMQLKWIPAVIEKVREKMFYEQKGQTGLFMGEVSV